MTPPLWRGTLQHALCSLSLIATFGCADIGGNSSDSATDKIINGQNESGHAYVVSLIDDRGASNCTGSLIAPKVVLTAAHCIKSIYGDHPPVAVELGAVIGARNNPRILVSSFIFKEGWSLGENNFNYDHDIALLFLQSEANVTPISYSTADHTQLVGQSILAVGYGNNNGFQGSGNGIKRSVALTVRETSPYYFVASWVGDTPLDTCQGDSGGPALLLSGDQAQVLGVVSNGPTYCQGNTQYTSTAAHKGWLSVHLSGRGASEQETTLPQQARYTSCAKTGACFKACKRATPDDSAHIEACKMTCYHESSATAQAHISELFSCNSMFQCNDENSCLSQYCADQMELCGLQTGTSTTPPEESPEPINSCTELSDCQLACGDNDGACVQRCYQRVSDTSSIAQLNNLISCLSRINCSDDACYESACREEYLACGYELTGGEGEAEERQPPPEPSASCAETYLCFSYCSDQACFDTCYSQAASASQGHIEALVACYNESPCVDFYDEMCMRSYCQLSYDACQSN